MESMLILIILRTTLRIRELDIKTIVKNIEYSRRWRIKPTRYT